ncbi:MAG TPA: KpsF/GutQ family sugar-phosphate isomerase, partial [Opitutales bacterium]|nr:KpsF/GutQ family sugar-phosphate isomerase [Opitutales bacterium]
KSKVLAAGRAVLTAEAAALQSVISRLDESFAGVVELIHRSSGKVVVTGIGKSALVAHSIAATLCSLGTPAVYLHAGEAAHGDIGIVAKGDVVILVSKSGATPELVRLAPALRSLGAKLVALTSNLRSPLANEADAVLDAQVAREADPLGLAPTSSALVALAVGHALAAALAQARGFTAEDFARTHPSGQLGRNLLLRVADVMHGLAEIAVTAPGDKMREAVVAMTRRPLGAACVVDAKGKLAGILTDGDVRRVLQQHDDIRPLTMADVMTRNPVRISPETLLGDALRIMEDRPSQISVLPVVDSKDKCLGLLRLHDIYQH